MLSVTATSERIRAGQLSPVDLLEECFRRIDALDGDLQAWVSLDRDGARFEARVRYEGVKHGGIGGALYGIPVGVKDIFDVKGLTTTAGASAFAHYEPEQDSAVAARLRKAGAIIAGKTATTEFAYADPAPTRNPWNRGHTPGGSSSGSAAAVAAGMVAVAIGSQTIGSTLRPAAYCGIVGLKAAHGRISAAGAVPLAWSLDHVGILSRCVADAALVLGALAGHDPADPSSLTAPVQDYVTAMGSLARPPRLGIPRAFYKGRASVEVYEHIDAVAASLERAGAEVNEATMPLSAEEVLAIGNPILRAEAAAYHAERFAAHQDEYRPRMRALIEAGLKTPAAEYLVAQRRRGVFRESIGALLEGFDALLMPVAPSTAPAGLESTGDAVFCAPASFAGLPAVSLPSGLDAQGLPLAVQLIGQPLDEGRLLAVASWVESRLDFKAAPPL